MNKKAKTIAAIDIGTNSIHMVIAQVSRRNNFNIVNRDKEMVRLGSSGSDMKYLSQEAMARGVKTLKHFAEIARSENAIIRAVATSAVREATNQHEFIEQVRKEAGIEAEVVSGAEEGRLIYLGAINAVSVGQKQILVIDIGGGSTETIIGKGAEIIYVDSHKLGSIRLTNRFFPDGNVTNAAINECRNFIRGEWSPILNRLKHLGFESVVVTSGTITNIALMSLALNNERIPEIINGLEVSTKEVTKVIKKVLSCKSTSQRQKLPGIDFARGDIITGGALILEHIINELNIKSLILSSFALREGIVFDTIAKMEEDSKLHHTSHLKYESVHHLCELYQVDMEHAEHICRIALKIYDALQDLHKLPQLEREYMEAAAILHDVGYHVSRDQHHKHSYYLIKNSVMPGYTNDELELIANVARYHRKSHPKKKHDGYNLLSEEKQKVVKILSAILRIAEGLDRRQLRNVADIKLYPSWLKEYNNYVKLKSTLEETKNLNANNRSKSLYVEIIPENNSVEPDIELWGAERRKLLLEEIFDINIEFSICRK